LEPAADLRRRSWIAEVADLAPQLPGVLTTLGMTTREVLQIWVEDAALPAVRCPLGKLFCRGVAR
jgi:hypothetical protein